MIRKERNASIFYDPEREVEGSYKVRSGFWGTETRKGTKKMPPRLHIYGGKGTRFSPPGWEGEGAERLWRDSKKEPRQVGNSEGKWFWLYDGDLYSTSEDDLEPEDVKALIEEQRNKKKLKIARAKAVAAMADGLDRKAQHQSIPREVKVAVWQRDKGACVQCGSKANLEYDHIIPLSMGGANTERNLQLLCGDCNREKGASI